MVVAPVFRDQARRGPPAVARALVADLVAKGRDAHAATSTADIVDRWRARRAAGDLVVVMSNGGFDGVHEKLLDALGARARSDRRHVATITR